MAEPPQSGKVIVTKPVPEVQVIITITQTSPGLYRAHVRLAPADNPISTIGIGQAVRGSYASPGEAVSAAGAVVDRLCTRHSVDISKAYQLINLKK